MKKSDAAEHLNVVVISLQRYRGIGKELLGPGSAELSFGEGRMEELWPWIWGEKCPLPSIIRALDRYEDSGYLEAIAYHNFMVLLFMKMPEIVLYCQASQGWRLSAGNKFPLGVPRIGEVMEGWNDERDL